MTAGLTRTEPHVKFGVCIQILLVAVAMRARRKVLRGVDGMNVAKGLRWCGDGRRIVCVAEGGKSTPLMNFDLVLVGTAATPRVISPNAPPPVSESDASDSISGSSIPPPCLPQNSFQKSKSLPVIGPRSSTQPSNHSSQLTLQLGNQARSRSMRMNFECMTENGRMKMLFTTKSNPSNSSGGGNPSLAHDSGGYT